MGTGAQLPSSHLSFSTDDVPKHVRIEYWEERNIEATVGLKCTTLAESGLEARANCLRIGSVRIVDISGNEHVIERTPKLVDNYEKDSIFLCLIACGPAFVYRAGNFVSLATGDLVAYDTNLAYMHGFPEHMRQIIFDFPGAEFRRKFGPWLNAGPMRLDGEVGTGRLIASLLRRKLAECRDVPADPSRLAGELWDTLALALGATQPASHVRATTVLSVLRAKAYVRERAGDPDLTGDDVAQAVGLSLRHLNRLLAAEHSSIADLIWVTRLDKAHAALAAASSRGATIAEIAYRCGFSSQAHFTRCFRDRFGITPSALRAADSRN